MTETPSPYGCSPRGSHDPQAHGRPLLDPEWSFEDALTLARYFGLGPLDDRHWKVITSCREETARIGAPPTLQHLEALTGFDAVQLRQLFSGDVVTLVARLAGFRLDSRATPGSAA